MGKREETARNSLVWFTELVAVVTDSELQLPTSLKWKTQSFPYLLLTGNGNGNVRLSNREWEVEGVKRES